MMRNLLLTLTGLAWASIALAASPEVADVMAIKPSQPGVVCDNPPASTWKQCKLQAHKNENVSGWTLVDSRGLVVRKLLDTNGDNVVDQWCYYANGQEIFRDIDTNATGKADACRWFTSAGSRWGIDANEDGKIEAWKRISAEETSAEIITALAQKDFERVRAVMLNADDARVLNLPASVAEKMNKVTAESAAKFQEVATNVGAGVQFNRFDGRSPMALPQDQSGMPDLLMYHNATIIADANGQSVWLRLGELVKVGETWKLCEMPTIITANQPVQHTGLLYSSPDARAASSTVSNDSMIEEGEEIQQYATALQKHDQALPDGSDVANMVAYHTRRAELCAHIGAKSKRLKNRQYWYEQTADSVNAAVQTGEYPQGIKTLEQYADQFAKTSWGKDLAAYYKYRAVNANYAVQLAQPGREHAKDQDAFLAQLKQFLTDYPNATDNADALWQLGNGMEFSGKDQDAIAYYKQILALPESNATGRAAGALRRLDSVGQPFRLVGDHLTNEGKIDTSAYKGKVLLIHYWANWCEPCKAEMVKLKRYREKYAQNGLEVIGVCLDNDKASGEAYVAKNGYSWPQVYEEGGMLSPPAIRYGVISLPFAMLVDDEGRVLNRNVHYNQLESELEKAMAKKVASSK